MWHSSEERDRIREECHATVSCMKMGLPETDDLCYRGLEFNHVKLGRKRRLTRRVAKAAVLDEFRHQVSAGALNPDALRDIYEAVVHQSKMEAFQRAHEDYIAITTNRRRHSSSSDLLAPSQEKTTLGSNARRTSQSHPVPSSLLLRG